MRTSPDVTSPSNNTLLLHDVVNVMQVLPSNGKDQWVKIWTLRDEYCAIKYNGVVNAEFAMPVSAAPQPDLTPDSPTEKISATFEQGYAKAVAELKTFIEGMPHAA